MKHKVHRVNQVEELVRQFRASPVAGVELRVDEPLAGHTRFGIGGAADVLLIARTTDGFVEAVRRTRKSGAAWVVIGGGSNLIVADAGFRGVVLQFAGNAIVRRNGGGEVVAEAGAVLQSLVDLTVALGLKGLETMTGIPGWVGGAVYGNAGAYGHSIAERITQVTFFDGAEIRHFDNAACEFRYRESIFKRKKEWVILSCALTLGAGEAAELQAIADDILRVRNAKYPPSMKCAGSIFKNFLWAELPARVQQMLPEGVVREGKVPSAWFLEQVGAKGLRAGDIQVADYHANLIYNAGSGTARDLVGLIGELKKRIGERFGIPLEEEVQYIGDVAG